MKIKSEDVERQDEDGIIRFIPASTRLHDEENLSQIGVAGPSGSERKKPGRLREKLSTRPFTRFDEPPDSGETEAPDVKTRWQKEAAKARAASRIESENFFINDVPEHCDNNGHVD
ncbi:uncharacterized protein LOC121871308 [Homarus americanus]|uniref:uncharacterized protein LOC121871308 n=1 Tax=Homarus americanus TaxID=6706 RepID=UPI001C452CB4|nr:uncharacterized protein LOC121871308 [Homarus americanus]